MNERDRDERGRPRNARPRDETGRPLPRDAAGAVAEETPPPLVGEAAVTSADELIAAGRPFAAHEVLEDTWHAADAAERDFWQGLAQVAVGLTHLQRGNSTGAIALLRRGAERLSAYAGTTMHGVEVARVRRDALDQADAIERGEPPAPGLRLHTGSQRPG